MPTDPAALRQAFQKLHESGCFVMPNPWDVGSARALQHLGFPALATTSAGMAFSLGLPDNGVPRDAVLEHVRGIARAVEVPVNADFESGYVLYKLLREVFPQKYQERLRFRPAPLVASFMQAPGVAHVGQIPVPKGPVETW